MFCCIHVRSQESLVSGGEDLGGGKVGLGIMTNSNEAWGDSGTIGFSSNGLPLYSDDWDKDMNRSKQSKKRDPFRLNLQI
jgi:hypothetical protein